MKRLIVALACLVLTAQSVQAQDEAGLCNSYPDVPVSVTQTLEAPTMDYSTDIADMEALKKSSHHFYERFLLGLVTYQPKVDIMMPSRAVSLSDGTTCVKIQSASIKIAFRDVVIHIAHEIPQGSCGEDAVITHERKHVMANEEVIQENMSLIQQKLHDYLRLYGMIRERNHEYALKVINDNVKGQVSELLRAVDQEDEQRQEQIDSKNEFIDLTRVCGEQLGRIGLRYKLDNKQ